MGASESSLSTTLRPEDQITTVSERTEGNPNSDHVPIGEQFDRSSSEEALDLLWTLNPKAVLELFSLYRDWQDAKIHKISQRQEEIENKIDVADALAAKLLQRFNYSVSSMKTTSQHLFEVHALQVEIGELKGRLTEVISNCDALCKRISLTGPESLQSSIKPFSAATANLRQTSEPSTGVLSLKQPSGEVDDD